MASSLNAVQRCRANTNSAKKTPSFVRAWISSHWHISNRSKLKPTVSHILQSVLRVFIGHPEYIRFSYDTYPPTFPNSIQFNFYI